MRAGIFRRSSPGEGRAALWGAGGPQSLAARAFGCPRGPRGSHPLESHEERRRRSRGPREASGESLGLLSRAK